MSDHTPGAWHVGNHVILHRNERGPMRHIVEYCWPITDPQMSADARLISAAPDLLALLQEAMDSRAPDMVDVGHPGWSDRARAVIAKATGK